MDNLRLMIVVTKSKKCDHKLDGYKLWITVYQIKLIIQVQYVVKLADQFFGKNKN